MPTAPLRLTVLQARRLAYRGQRLSGPRVGRDGASLLQLVRDLGCLQIDPVSVVARTQLLVTWSRVGRFRPATLQQLHEVDRSLFEYWAHAASLVPSSDLPIHRWTMHRAFSGSSARDVRMQEWLATNDDVRRELLATLDRDGPLRTQDLTHLAVHPWAKGGWSDEKTVALMLEVLTASGEVLVSRRTGGTRWWDIGARCLPPGALDDTDVLDETEVVRRAAVKAVRALGVATPAQVTRHFTRRRYPQLGARLAELVADDVLVPATVEGLKGQWYLHADDAATLDDLTPARLTLLSPFDNLICDRDRTEALWGFRYRLEIYTPVAKREYGYYVMPVLEGDRLVGRIDAALDTGTNLLAAKSVHVEPGVRTSTGRTARVRRRFEDLARFVGADGIDDVTGALT
ncbi:MAG: winged helix-turn-helix domain-containing protein [Acidimicrobiales bacterium]